MKNTAKVVLQGSREYISRYDIRNLSLEYTCCPRKKSKNLRLILLFLQFPESRNMLTASTDYMENRNKNKLLNMLKYEIEECDPTEFIRN
jgi:hypothetical protein